MPYSSNQSVWPSVDLFSMNHQTSIKSTALNLIPGVVWGIGNLFMFYSQPKVGVATSFSLSQLLVIVSTLGGIFILGEKKIVAK